MFNILDFLFWLFSDLTLNLLLIPFIGILLILIFPFGKLTKYLGLYTTILNLIVTLLILIKFNPLFNNFQFLTTINFLWPINLKIQKFIRNYK